MSHVDTIDCPEINENTINLLQKAAESLGLELVKQDTYRWYGRHVGDYPIPYGFKKADLGRCEYALRIPGNKQAYEVGIAKYPEGATKTVVNADGSTQEVPAKGYAMLWDFYCGGFGLEKAIGAKGGKLVQSYAENLASRAAAFANMSLQNRKVLADGSIQMVFDA